MKILRFKLKMKCVSAGGKKLRSIMWQPLVKHSLYLSEIRLRQLWLIINLHCLPCGCTFCVCVHLYLVWPLFLGCQTGVCYGTPGHLCNIIIDLQVRIADVRRSRIQRFVAPVDSRPVDSVRIDFHHIWREIIDGNFGCTIPCVVFTVNVGSVLYGQLVLG